MLLDVLIRFEHIVQLLTNLRWEERFLLALLLTLECQLLVDPFPTPLQEGLGEGLAIPSSYENGVLLVVIWPV